MSDKALDGTTQAALNVRVATSRSRVSGYMGLPNCDQVKAVAFSVAGDLRENPGEPNMGEKS